MTDTLPAGASSRVFRFTEMRSQSLPGASDKLY
jgi:hypothetical protein